MGSGISLLTSCCNKDNKNQEFQEIKNGKWYITSN